MLYIPRNRPFQRYHDDITDDFNWTPTTQQLNYLRGKEFTCDCCALRSKPTHKVLSGYMEIFTMGNFRSVLCVLCMQAQHIGRPVRDNLSVDHGCIIYCPQLSQGDISQIAQYAGIAKLRDESVSPRMQAFVNEMATDLSALATRELLLPSEEFPNGVSAALFVEICANMSPQVRAAETQVFANLRYLPQKDFGKQLQFWGEVSPDLSTIPSYEEAIVAH